MKVAELFKVHIAKSHSFSTYQIGDTAFITNGFTNNGVQGFVKPLKGDRLFNFQGICVSAFCEATVQKPPFIGRGNGGSGVIVLEPLKDMSTQELLAYASSFNENIRWRFSYGRMISKDRILRLDVPRIDVKISNITEIDFLPHAKRTKIENIKLLYGTIPLISIFELHSGDYHNADTLPDGNIPLVSCGEKNNGIMKFIKSPKDKIYENTLTIAYNGQPLTTNFHPYKFSAKDDVAVCLAKKKLKLSTLIFIQLVINSEKWRYSYGRKCFKEKLSQVNLSLPIANNGEPDEKIIEEIVRNTSYWHFLYNCFQNDITLRRDIVA